jgi:hypothetical protein
MSMDKVDTTIIDINRCIMSTLNDSKMFNAQCLVLIFEVHFL